MSVELILALAIAGWVALYDRLSHLADGLIFWRAAIERAAETPWLLIPEAMDLPGAALEPPPPRLTTPRRVAT